MKDNVVSLMLRSWQFLLLRAFVVIVLAIPFIYLYNLGVELCLKYFGDYAIAKLAYCYIACAAWFCCMTAIRKYLLYMIGASQMCAIAQYLTGAKDYIGILSGFIGTVKKAGRVHILFALNCLIEITINKFMASAVQDIQILGNFSNTFLGKFSGKALNMIGNHIDEAVMCYGFAEEDEGFMDSIIEGLSLYLACWKDVAMSSVYAIISLFVMKYFYIFSCIYFVISYGELSLELITIKSVMICIISYILYYALYEPYVTILLLKKYIIKAIDAELTDEIYERVEQAISTLKANRRWDELRNLDMRTQSEGFLSQLLGPLDRSEESPNEEPTEEDDIIESNT